MARETGAADVARPDRSRLPEPGPVKPFEFPTIHKSTCGSGLRIWTVHHPSIPVVSLMLLVRRGAAFDPPGSRAWRP